MPLNPSIESGDRSHGATAIESVAQLSTLLEDTDPTLDPELGRMARRVATEGLVLLRNEGDALPLAGRRVALFGRVQLDWFAVGYGSGGDVKVPYVWNLVTGLRDAGIQLDDEIAGLYASWCAANPPELNGSWGQCRGDPSSALLEVLDPEQNHTFQDHYIEVDFDLSDVMFVATSNTLNIPPALLDRMEVIRLSGYTEDEKIHIARDHLLPKLMKNNGVKDSELTVDESALRDIVRYYTREAGVRALEREVGKICRKVVKQLLAQSDRAKEEGKAPETKPVNVTAENLSDYLGVRRYTFGMAEKENQIGQVTGLAWTEVGGDLLTIEVADMPGKGVIQRTGSLGDVMKESVEAARTVVRSRARRLGFADSVFEKHDMHVHVPEGATPKDGPSAGIAITTAMVSALSRIPVRADVAMTGEITLRGEVLPIGGLKEKLLAAHRGGIKTVLIPEENVKDLAEIPDNVKNQLEIVPVRWIDKVLELALERLPEPLAEEEAVKEPLVGKPAESESGDPVLKH